jgi:choline dehydrogenase-like flavoprotein
MFMTPAVWETPHASAPHDNQAERKAWDAIVIGSGPGGSTIALRLAQHGAKTLVIERGDFLHRDLADMDAPEGRYLYDVVAPGEPLDFVGGQTKFYGAALYRFRENDLRAVDHGCGVSPAWPFSYGTIEPYYQQAETLYRVHGAPATDPTEPPRREALPYPALPHDPLVARVVARLERSGTKVSAIPRAIDYGPEGKCVLCAACDSHYCARDAKMDAEIAALRPALATGQVSLLTRTECLHVLTSPYGRRATGVVLRDGDGMRTADAGTVIVAAGMPGSAILLRRSRTEQHPEGLGNAGGALGRYMSGHSVGGIFPLISWRKLPPIHSKTFGINTYHDGAPGWPHPLGVIQIAGHQPFWRTYPPSAMRVLAPLICAHSLIAYYSTEALPTSQSGLVFDGDTVAERIEPTHNLAAFEQLRGLAIDAFRRAGYPVLARRRPPYLWHEVGTACLGKDPQHSVVDPDCQVHGIGGLYVVDQSVLPSAGTVNTGLTIIALAMRAGDHIAGVAATAIPATQPVA